MSFISPIPAVPHEMMDLKFEGAELGCGSVLVPNTAKYVSAAANGDTQFGKSFSQYKRAIRIKQGKYYLREKSVIEQRNRDGNFGRQDQKASMKYIKAVNQFVPSPSVYGMSPDKEEEIKAADVEQGECNEQYGTTTTVEAGNKMKKEAEAIVKEEERPQADKVGFRPGGGYQYGFAYQNQMRKNLANNQRDMPENLTITTQDTHSIDTQAYLDNYGKLDTKLDKMYDISRNPDSDPNAPPKNVPDIARYNVVEAEASELQKQYYRRI